ncbi:hypothetical protein DL764_010061 [Monosporascus ibericus]|uniref:Uncharacterized protein n=1 Tax=Monosporascus ibericus TaxID=155417 RepID=A0A4V1X8T2_9PEZI|nr:hypothetical protein DL764_010061 [Monosporascus ibericus]
MALDQHLRSLANSKHGPPAASLREAVVMCVTPTALYGTEAWYCGRRKPGPMHRACGKRKSTPEWGGMLMSYNEHLS